MYKKRRVAVILNHNDNGATHRSIVASFLKFTFIPYMARQSEPEVPSKMALSITPIWPITIWWRFCITNVQVYEARNTKISNQILCWYCLMLSQTFFHILFFLAFVQCVVNNGFNFWQTCLLFYKINGVLYSFPLPITVIRELILYSKGTPNMSLIKLFIPTINTDILYYNIHWWFWWSMGL